MPVGRECASCCRRAGDQGRDAQGARRLVARAGGRAKLGVRRPSRSTASIRSTSSTPRGSTGKPKGILHTTGGYLLGHADDDEVGLRPQGGRHLLVHRRHRLGDGAQLHRLRPAGGGRDGRDVRGRAELSRERSLLGDHREVPRQHPLHRADRDPRVHQVGRPVGQEARPVEPAAAGHGRRADQSRGVDVVSQGHRRRALPDRRYLVADRDRRDHDRAVPGAIADQAGLGDAAAAGRRRRGRHARGQARRRQPGRLAGHPQAVAGDAAHDLRRRRALQDSSTSAKSTACTSPATARGATRTATSGSWAASTT